ncbi:MAG: DUF2235 domain-containing protein [Acidobacteriia bacterium]|nr:DUF2235 domain-containing protein [Terriglobia bacterium]
MKRIVICADGTWNQRDQVDKVTKKRRPTNVTKVARAVRPRAGNGTDQVVCYHDGVGTAEGLDKFTGGAFGHGIEGNIRELYRFLVYNYEAGDELYFFGFSRGAFTVRTLIGFMNKVGLIQKDDDYYVPDLYAYYESGKGPDSQEYTLAYHNIKDPRPCPPIRFVGVWDTVGALGAPGFLGQLLNKNKYQYHDVNLNANIQNAYHALAIDEERKPFAPNIWTRPANWSGTLEQIWFAGVHSNVGGGYAPDGLANEALHWLVEKAEGLGLEFDKVFLGYYKPCFNSVLQDSMTVLYRTMGRYVRPIGQADGEAVHQSAVDRMNLPECDYHPDNLRVYLAGPGNTPLVGTARVPRGTPC